MKQKYLDTITIKGFKSIRALEDFELKNLNVLIGSNGAGKTNFIDFFRLVRAMMELPLPKLKNTNLNSFVLQNGGSDAFLFNGPKITDQIEIQIMFGDNGYRFKLIPTTEEKFMINDEARYYKKYQTGWNELGSGYTSPKILEDKDKKGYAGGHSVGHYVYNAISSWKIYHFHDTSLFAPVRRSEIIEDNKYLRFDASNIAPYLYHLRENNIKIYNQIVDTIQMVAPFFEDFILDIDSNEKVRLNWRQKGSDYPFRPNQLSDGTIRFICLTTALLQPNPPSTLIIDEPAIGLHPYAIEILSELIKTVSESTQIIISTQSATLVDCFSPEDIITVNRKNGESIFYRPNNEELSEWLKDYSLGDLWIKNIIQGGPSYE